MLRFGRCADPIRNTSRRWRSVTLLACCNRAGLAVAGLPVETCEDASCAGRACCWWAIFLTPRLLPPPLLSPAPLLLPPLLPLMPQLGGTRWGGTRWGGLEPGKVRPISAGCRARALSFEPMSIRRDATRGARSLHTRSRSAHDMYASCSSSSPDTASHHSRC